MKLPYGLLPLLYFAAATPAAAQAQAVAAPDAQDKAESAPAVATVDEQQPAQDVAQTDETADADSSGADIFSHDTITVLLDGTVSRS